MSDVPPLFLDSETRVAGEHFAVVYAPRSQRKRFPANCVQLVTDAESARKAADPEKHLYPASVVGPSKSSEGLIMYYLVRWL